MALALAFSLRQPRGVGESRTHGRGRVPSPVHIALSARVEIVPRHVRCPGYRRVTTRRRFDEIPNGGGAMAGRIRIRHWKRWLALGAVVVALAVVGGPFIYIHFVEGKAPAPLTLGS